MSDVIIPRRSVLYMPGANARALEKAKELPTDAVIFDLEDAVAPDAKQTAREQVVAAVESKAYGHREIVVRVNGLDTEWGADDVAAIAAIGPDAMLFPKISSADDVKAAVAAMKKAGAPDSTDMWAMIETPTAFLHAEEIAAADPRLVCFVMGTNDLAKDLHANHTELRLPMITGLGLALLAGRAHGLTLLDGVYNDIQNTDGFRSECVQGNNLGFDGKTLIHPSQLEPCNDVYGPSDAQLEEARAIIEGFEEAQKAGKGVVTVNGRMIENLHVEHAKRQVAMAHAIDGLAS